MGFLPKPFPKSTSFLKEEKMAEAIHFQRVTIHLKNGTNLVLDLKPEDHQTVDSQITALQDVLADPESQEKVFTFQFRGIRGDSWIRIKEIVAFDAVPLIFTPAEREKAKAE
jgi:hypothetical protein